jgi:queuine tRNA-ribosyltransferase
MIVLTQARMLCMYMYRSYHDGTVKTLTPESSIQIQRALGADIILVLDECTPFHVDKEYTAESMRRSHR